VNLVYSAASRKTGDPDAAEEIPQASTRKLNVDSTTLQRLYSWEQGALETKSQKTVGKRIAPGKNARAKLARYPLEADDEKPKANACALPQSGLGASGSVEGEYWRWCPRCGHELHNEKCKLRCPSGSLQVSEAKTRKKREKYLGKLGLGCGF
jgi:hypothetical protein